MIASEDLLTSDPMTTLILTPSLPRSSKAASSNGAAASDSHGAALDADAAGAVFGSADRAPFGEHPNVLTAQRDFGYGVETFEFEESGENACEALIPDMSC